MGGFPPIPALQMCGCEDFLKPSLGMSDNSNLVAGKKPKFIFPLNYSAAYLSSLKGIKDELSCCSKPEQERSSQEGKMQRQKGPASQGSSHLSLESLEFARSKRKGDDFQGAHTHTHVHACTHTHARTYAHGHTFQEETRVPWVRVAFLPALGNPLLSSILEAQYHLSSAPSLDTSQRKEQGAQDLQGRQGTHVLASPGMTSLASPGQLP